METSPISLFANLKLDASARNDLTAVGVYFRIKTNDKNSVRQAIVISVIELGLFHYWEVPFYSKKSRFRKNRLIPLKII